MIKLIAILLLVVLLGVFALVGFYAATMARQPNYQAKDYDPESTRRARTALPIIRALDAYRQNKGSFPGHTKDLLPYLPPGPSFTHYPEEYSINHWGYSHSADENGYDLAFSLMNSQEHDATLIYQFDGVKGTWVFDDGGGEPTKNILLSP